MTELSPEIVRRALEDAQHPEMEKSLVELGMVGDITSRLAERHRPRGSSSDDVAACYLLQSYLDHRARRKA